MYVIYVIYVIYAIYVIYVIYVIQNCKQRRIRGSDPSPPVRAGRSTHDNENFPHPPPTDAAFFSRCILSYFLFHPHHQTQDADVCAGASPAIFGHPSEEVCEILGPLAALPDDGHGHFQDQDEEGRGRARVCAQEVAV